MDTLFAADQFFAGRPEEWALFEALRRALMARWPGTQMRAMKSCVSFDDPKPYAYVSHPPRKAMKGILLTFSARTPVQSPRFFHVTPISKSRFTVHMLLSDEGDIDEELFSLLEGSRR